MFPEILINATFADGTTMLFRRYEKVWVADWISDNGKYFTGEHHGFAEDLIKEGVHVVDRDNYGLKAAETVAKIVRVIEVDTQPPFCKIPAIPGVTG